MPHPRAKQLVDNLPSLSEEAKRNLAGLLSTLIEIDLEQEEESEKPIG